MCGIAGYSLAPHSRLDRTLAAQALLAAIAERGTDAVGYAYPAPSGASGPAVVVKQQTPASRLLEHVTVPAGTNEAIVHVRDFTKGHPSVAANNHPIRHGPVVGVHNGRIENDDELLAEYACARAEPSMTVDSEAVFALAAHSRGDAKAFEALEGSMAAAWLDERRPGVLHIARGVGRPLWLGTWQNGVVFASTAYALSLFEQLCGPKVRKRELGDGTQLALRHGQVVRRQRFRTPPCPETDALPADGGLADRAVCLSRLATIAATT
jgi:glucosamine 6-phosphate synthetase-like amidotransferase/phosphosugar isomerase protein